MNNENEDRPRRNHVKKIARSVKLRDEELHHPLHPPYVRKKEWKKDITTDDDESKD